MRSFKCTAKRQLAFLLSAVLMCTSVPTAVFSLGESGAVTTQAQAKAGVSVNATDVTLYGMNQTWEEYISIPSDLPQSFQLKVSGASAVTYKVVSGYSVSVSSDGLITPKYTTYYWVGNFGFSSPPAGGYDRVTVNVYFGESTLEVKADGQIFEVTVDLEDYAQVYTNRVLDEFIAANVTDSMTDYEKLELATKYAADHEYSTSYYTTAGMVISGGGDCVASSSTIVALCEKMGISAWIRSAAREYVGTTHRNVMAEIDGKYYIADAGYSEPAPRYYSIKERDSLFCYRTVDGGIELIQYDGKTDPTVLDIPSEISGKTVVGLGESFYSNSSSTSVNLPSTLKYIKDSAFLNCAELKSINIPASVTDIGDSVFSNCDSLTELTCDPANPNYTAEDCILYNKDKTILLSAPSVSELTFPSSVKAIAPYAFEGNSNLTEVTVPDTVKTIGEGAFARCVYLKTVTIPNTITEISDSVFYLCYDLAYLYYMGTRDEWNVVVVGKANDLLSNAKIRCIDDPCEHIYGEWVETQASTCTVKGSERRDCTACDAFETREKELAAHKYGEWVETQAPTCTEKGSERRDCTACDAYETREKKATGHSYTEVVTAPTCTAAGYTTCTCACGATYKKNYTNPTGHSYTDIVVTAPTCTASGYTTYTCACGAVKKGNYVSATGHSYTEVVTAPTCAAMGYTTHTCFCGYSYKDTYTSKTAHSYSYKVTKAPTTSATGTLTATCSKCLGTTTKTLPKLTTTDYNYTVTKAATCTATGTGRYSWKNITYGSFYFDVTIPATGHTYTAKVTAPTCTAKGYTTYTCACGDSYKGSYVNAVGHRYGEWVVVKAPAVGISGEERRECAKCDAYETRKLPALTEKGAIPGDVNSDGAFDLLDVLLMQQYLSGWDVELDTDAGDVNDDGETNLLDVLLMQQSLAGWDVELI